MNKILANRVPLSQRAHLFLLAVLYSVFAALSVSIVMPFVNIIFAHAATPFPGLSFPQWLSPYRALLLLCGLTWGFFLLKNLFHFLSMRQKTLMETGLTTQLRSVYLRELFLCDINFFHNTPGAELNVRLIQTTEKIAEKKIDAFFKLAKNSVLSTLYVAILVAISWKLMLAGLLAVPVVSWLTQQLRKKNLHRIERQQTAWIRLTQDVQQKLFAIKLIKIFFSERYESEKFARKNFDLAEARKRLKFSEAFYYAVIEMLGVTAGVALLWLAGLENLGGQFAYGPGGFVLFIAAVFSLIDPAKELHEARQQRAEAHALAEQLAQLPVPSRPPATEPMAERFETIALNHVSFGYSGILFENVSLKIRRGEKIALTGKSGAGKSTLIDLITGLQQPSRGEITINGRNVATISRGTLARIFGVITQEPLLFHDTLYHNVAYNLGDIEASKVLEALRLTHAADLVRKPEDLHVPIGERGNKLSGGEKQRIVLARMVLRNPEVLILDEATSALDETMERDILQMIFTLFKEQTIVMVSHRPSVLAFAERVLEIRGFRVIEKIIEPIPIT